MSAGYAVAGLLSRDPRGDYIRKPGDGLVPSCRGRRWIMEFEMVPIGKLRKNPFNPRKTFDPAPGQDELGLNQLADSIRNDGVLQPIIVRRLNSNFQVAAGERRRMASEVAG